MNKQDIARLRIQQQAIQPRSASSLELVRSMGAFQAQDYPGALWSLGLRSITHSKNDVDTAINNRQILRTWPMRGTLHLIPAEDAHWMLATLGPRILASMAGRQAQLGLSETTFKTARSALISALKGGNILTRSDTFAVLQQAGISTSNQRGNHILRRLSLEKLICFGPHVGKQPTFVLLDEWVKKPVLLDRDEALGELARRYFTSHGPAKLKDFAWWSNAPMKDARIGLEQAEPWLQSITVDGEDYWLAKDVELTTYQNETAYLLPGFDEFMLGYQDRSAALPNKFASRICPGNNGMFISSIVIDGQVRGTWKKTVTTKAITITPQPFEPFTQSEQRACEAAAEAYATYSNIPVLFDWLK